MKKEEKNMLNILIWGAGKNCKFIIEAINKDKCNLIGIVDMNRQLHQKYYMNKWLIDSPEKLINNRIDFVIISAQNSIGILEECQKLGLKKEKVIDYWNSNKEYEFLDINLKKISELEKRITKLDRRLKNIPYELGIKSVPQIRPAKELLEIIINDKKSLSRFGDGELEIMQNRQRPWFQIADERLAERLKQVFSCKDERIIIALADDFGNLEHYTEEAADGIRSYLDNGIREKVMGVIDMNRVYYDAYVTRPYLMYKDKNYALDIFQLFKKIWKNREILLVEGSQACIGVRNDLLDSASSIRRIIAPLKNAFSVYDEILSLVRENIFENILVLISLGPTATVLAYDLAMEGIQALDIGQLDNEYEWYLRGAVERIDIPGKYVAELRQYCEVAIIEDINYEEQIIGKIEIK